jgi:hypothetical protein
MDSDDEKDLFHVWKRFDDQLNTATEKIVWKFIPVLDKFVKEKLGWRRKKPEDDFERFQEFMTYVKTVYLIPSLIEEDSQYDSSESDSFDYDWTDEPEQTTIPVT